MSSSRVAARMRIKGSSLDSGVSAAELAAAARRLEGIGIEALFVDVTPGSGVDPYVALGSAVTSTETLLLGSAASVDDERLPSMLAKVATGLDVVSQGRGVAVLSSGGLQDLERLRERVEIVRAMARVDAPTVTGRHFHIDAAWNEPRRSSQSAMAVGLFLTDASHAGTVDASELEGVLEVAVRLCELCIMSVHDDVAAAVLADLPAMCRRAGRQRSELTLLAVVGQGPIDVVIERRRLLEEMGFDGVVLDIPEGIDGAVLELAAALVGGARSATAVGS